MILNLLGAFCLKNPEKSGQLSQWNAYGGTVPESADGIKLGKENKRIVVLDADLGGSTMGKLFE